MRREFVPVGERWAAFEKAPWAVMLKKFEGGYMAFESFPEGRIWEYEQEAKAAEAASNPQPVDHHLVGIAMEGDLYRWACSCARHALYSSFSEEAARKAHAGHAGAYAERLAV